MTYCVIEPGGLNTVSAPFQIDAPVIFTATGLGLAGVATLELLTLAEVPSASESRGCLRFSSSTLTVVSSQTVNCWAVCDRAGIAGWGVPGWYRIRLTGATLPTARVCVQSSSFEQIESLRTDCADCLALTAECARIALPEGGFAFGLTDARPADANVPLLDCFGVTVGFIYALSDTGHSVPVSECGTATIVGFAANASSCTSAGGGADGNVTIVGPVQVDIPVLPRIAIDLEQVGTNLVTLFSDGTTTATPLDCASLPLPDGGYLFAPSDNRPAAANVVVLDCAGTTVGFAYAAPGPGHGVPVAECGTNVIVGYAENTSACAQATACSPAPAPGPGGPPGPAPAPVGITAVDFQEVDGALVTLFSNGTTTSVALPCPSVALPGGGFLFASADVRAPGATTAVLDCAGATIGFAFPAAGPGHTVEVIECGTSTVVGFAANTSRCAPQENCGCPEALGSAPGAAAPIGRVLVTAVNTGSQTTLFYSDGTQEVANRPCGSPVATGVARCAAGVVEQQSVDACGALSWVVTAATCYCPSIALAGGGYVFDPVDSPRDPLATAALTDCGGNTIAFAFPSAGNGHSQPIYEQGNPVPVAFAQNSSTCGGSGCPESCG